MAETRHHLVLGELTDFITGEVLEDTHDERFRQQLARFLVAEKKFAKDDITPRVKLLAQAGKNRAIVPVDFKITLAKRVLMIIKYGPGSIVTRRRSALAASRLITSYQVPLAVVFNGLDAETLDAGTGKIRSRGLDGIPNKADVLAEFADAILQPIAPRRAEMEARILYAYEINDSCPCDDTVCRLPDADGLRPKH